MGRRTERVGAMAAAVAVFVTGLVLVTSPPAEAEDLPGCGYAVEDCNAYGWGTEVGFISVSTTEAQIGDVIRITGTANYPPPVWRWTDGGPVPQGVSSVGLSGPGTVVDYGPKTSATVSAAAGPSSVSWSGIETTEPGECQYGGECAGTPTSRFATGAQFWIDIEVTSSPGRRAARADFGANRGYVGWSPSAQRVVTVLDGEARPKPSLTITPAKTSIAVGEETDVAVKVTTGGGKGSLQGLQFQDGAVLDVGDSGALEVVSGGTPGAPFSMGPNATVTKTVRVRGVAGGSASLGSSIKGATDQGNAVAASGTGGPVDVKVSGLDLKVKLDETEFEIEEDADGPKPATRTLTVEATNTTQEQVTDVVLLPFVPAWQEGLPFTSVFPATIVSVTEGPPEEGLELGDVDPGEKITKTFEVQVTDDGHLNLSTSATWTDAGGNADRSVGEVDFVARPKYLLSFSAEADASVDDNPADPWNGKGEVAVRRNFLITGKAKNLTTDQRIVATVPATDRRFISSVNLVDLATDWDAPATPYRVEIDAGSTEAFHGKPIALPVPERENVPTEAKVVYTPEGIAQLKDSEDDTAAFDIERVLTTDAARGFEVPIAWPPAEEAPTAIELYGLYSKGFIESTAAYWSGAADTALKGLEMVGYIELQAWKLVSGDPATQEAFRQKVTGAWASFVNTLDLYSQTLEAMTPAQRAEAAAIAANPVLLFWYAAHKYATPEKVEQARTAINGSIQAMFTKMIDFSNQDPRVIAEELGRGSATVYNEVTAGMITDAAIAHLFTKIKYGKNLADSQKYVDELAEAAARDGLKLEKGLKGIPPGAVLTPEVLAVGLGISKAEAAQIYAVAKKYNLRIMARSRGASSIELLEKGLARPKPFGIDAKNVNDIDRLLGFPEALKDRVVIRKPNAWSDVVATPDYVAATREQRAQIASRWQTRSKEWSGAGELTESSAGVWTVKTPPGDGIGAERQKFLDYAAKGEAPLQFPTKGNAEEIWNKDLGKPLGTANAEFELKTFVGADGVEYHVPRMSDGAPGSKLLDITGDVDLVALLNPDGTFPDVEKLIAAYADLAKPPLRMQHPATWSFGVEGKSKALLEDHMLGGATEEPLADFNPLGFATAVLFDKKQSLIPADRLANAATFVKVAGGIKLPSHAYGLGAVAPLTFELGQQTRDYYTPEDWTQARGGGETAPPTRGSSARAAQTEVRAVTGERGVVFSRSAPPVAQQSRSVLVQYLAGAWAPWSPLPAGPLAIAPQTCAADAIDAGDQVVAVCPLTMLFERSGTKGQAWFQPGDRVALDLGDGSEWITTVSAVSADSITFADAAPRSYLAGTTIQLLTGAGRPGSGPAPTTVTAGGGGGQGTGSAPGALVRTGSDLGPLTVAGLCLLAVGVLALAVRRRRPTA